MRAKSGQRAIDILDTWFNRAGEMVDGLAAETCMAFRCHCSKGAAPLVEFICRFEILADTARQVRKLPRSASHKARLLRKTVKIPKGPENEAVRSDIWIEARRIEGAALRNTAAIHARITMRSHGQAQSPASRLHFVCSWVDGNVGEALGRMACAHCSREYPSNGKRNAFNRYCNS